MSDQAQSSIQIALTKLTLAPARVDSAEAEHHLAQLRTHHPARPAEARGPSMGGPRRLGRWLTRERERASAAGERMRRAVESPRNRIGWSIAHLGLMRWPTIGRRTLFLIALLALVAVARYADLPLVGSVSSTVAGLFFVAVLTAALVAAWGDVFRLPLHAKRVRRRIARSPWCVLPTTASTQQRELMGRVEVPPVVPRQELYDELLPGILDRSRRDIQVVVGEPGSGKTTALVDISRLLARIGIVPVVVPLGNEVPEDLVGMAKKRFMTNASSLLGSEARLGEVWEWMREHRRVVVLVDDLDRIAPDGERGFMVRSGLNELAAEGLPAVVTTRPAGIPAGLAASAIALESLDEEDAVENVLRTAREEHGAAARNLGSPEVRGNVARWIREGSFAEVPFYLELLARLVAAGRCAELAPARTLVDDFDSDPRVRRKADGRCEWNPLWVRFRLLERYYEQVAEGRVRRWLGIEPRERERCLQALGEAALSTLAASSLEVLPEYDPDDPRAARLRVEIEDFLDPDDRHGYRADLGRRQSVSAHEVVETGERLCILDRDPHGKLLFKHRILQAYLAGRSLSGKLAAQPPEGDLHWHECERLDLLGALLDPRHPDRLTARMALTFAALFASPQARHESQGVVGIDRLLQRLVNEAGKRATSKAEGREKDQRERRIDPRRRFDLEAYRVDPDDALSLLTTAAEIASATGRLQGVVSVEGRSIDTMGAILRGVGLAPGATRWTKVNAIPVIAGLSGNAAGGTSVDEGRRRERLQEQWTRVWEFARDPDEKVRREASAAMADDAYSAYAALERGIEALLTQAALKSARDLPLDTVGRTGGGVRAEAFSDQWLGAELAAYGLHEPKQQVDSLCALGWVLPAIVSGLREQPLSSVEQGFSQVQRRNGGGDGAGGEEYAEVVNRARQALERLVTLAFQRRFPELEASLARGFKSDAMRHLDDPDRGRGHGFVDSNRQLVSDICVDNAHYWYAKLVLSQALALYTIAGSSPKVALDTYARLLRRDAEPHPFVARAARQARRAVRRHMLGSERWKAFIWADEGEAVSRRQAAMNPVAGQLLGDVTLLLNLRQGAPEDLRTQSSRTSRLPHCLSQSRDRLEVLGAGCPRECGCGLCPLAEAPVDEPDGKRTISRAFCRGQQKVARHHAPPWHSRIRRGALREFWYEMERRART